MDPKAKRAELLKQAQAIVDGAKAEGKDLSDEQVAQIETLTAEADKIKADIEKAEKRQALAAKVARDLDGLKAPEAPRTVTSVTANTALSQVIEVGDELEAEDPKRKFRNQEDYFAAVYDACVPGGRFDARLQRLERQAAAGSAATLSDGSQLGFLVPPEFSQGVWDEMNKDSLSLLSMCDQYTVTGESLTLTANAETSRVTGSRYGGVRGYWGAENTQMTESKPKVRQLKLEPKEFYVFIPVSNKLLRRGGGAVTQYISRAAQEEIVWGVNEALMNGTGAGQPLGITAGANVVSVSAESGQTASTPLVSQNVLKMFARLASPCRSGAVWFIDQSLEPWLCSMVIEGGASSTPVYLPPGGFSGKPYGSLLGLPVIPTDGHNAAAATNKDIVLTNPKYHAVGVVGSGVETAMSSHLRFDYNESVWRWGIEMDSQPFLASAITPANSGNSLSSTVTLATRS